MSNALFKEIAYCTDFSEHADEAFLTARDLAVRFGARLHIVHAMVSLSAPVDESYMPVEHDSRFVEKVTQAARESIQDRYISQLPEGQVCETHLETGYPATRIIEVVKKNEVDLIVMGSHGLTGLAHVLFGSTADRVVRKAPCSVLTVRFPQAKP